MVHVLLRLWVRAEKLTLIGLLFAFILIRPDHLIFPQTQAFAFGFLLLLVWNLGRRPSRMTPAQFMFAAALMIILVCSHTVCSAASLAILTAVAWESMVKKSAKSAAMFGGLALIGMILFAWMNAQPYPPAMAHSFPTERRVDSSRIGIWTLLGCDTLNPHLF